MSRLLTRKEIESVTKNFPRNKSPGPDVFTGGFNNEHQPFSNFSNKVEGRRKLPNSFYEASITLPDKDTTRKESYNPIFLIDAKILNKILANPSSSIH